MYALRFFCRFFANFLIVQSILNQTISQAISLQRGQKSFGNFIEHTNYILDVTKIESKPVIGMTHCLLECVKNHDCFSTNVAVDRNNNRNFTCELLPTDKYNASMSFKRRNLFHHFSLVVRSQCVV